MNERMNGLCTAVGQLICRAFTVNSLCYIVIYSMQQKFKVAPPSPSTEKI